MRRDGGHCRHLFPGDESFSSLSSFFLFFFYRPSSIAIILFSKTHKKKGKEPKQHDVRKKSKMLL